MGCCYAKDEGLYCPLFTHNNDNKAIPYRGCSMQHSPNYYNDTTLSTIFPIPVIEKVFMPIPRNMVKKA